MDDMGLLNNTVFIKIEWSDIGGGCPARYWITLVKLISHVLWTEYCIQSTEYTCRTDIRTEAISKYIPVSVSSIIHLNYHSLNTTLSISHPGKKEKKKGGKEDTK